MNLPGKWGMLNSGGQGTIEYAVLICILVAALISMKVYMQRGFEGKMKKSADQISGGTLYAPGAMASNIEISQVIKENTEQYPQDYSGDWKSRITVYTYEFDKTKITGRDEKISPLAKEH